MLPDNRRMSLQKSRPWALYLTTFVAALLVAASAVYWALGVMGASSQHAQRAPILASAPTSELRDLAQALGGGQASSDKPPETASTQYQLLGVVAGPVGKGYALIAVGGAPPKTFVVGAELASGLVLQSVSSRGVKLGTALRGNAAVELSLPKPPGE